jgi:chloramphenicol-sensitive protein RarD
MSDGAIDEAAQAEATKARSGIAALLTGYTIWGLLPLYLRALHGIPAPLIIAYRLVLCCVVVLVWLGVRRELSSVRAALSDARTR